MAEPPTPTLTRNQSPLPRGTERDEMTPFELVQWSIAGMFSLILLGLGLGIALVLIVSALRTKPRVDK